MKGNNLTIIVQPDWKAVTKRVQPVRSFSINKRVIFYAFICVILLILFGVRGSWSIHEYFAIKHNVSQLKQELRYIAGITTDVDSIRKEERMIRDFLGLDGQKQHFDLNDRMGKGGTEPINVSEMPLNDSINQELKHEDHVRPLHERVHYLREDMQELSGLLSRMAATLRNRPTIMPVKDDDIWITSGFGWRKSPFTGLREFHKGLDISGKKGALIIATADGFVTKTGFNRFIGHYVNIKHDVRFETMYGHLLKYVVKEGQRVKRGQLIGYMGTSGLSTGYHLHYEIGDNERKVNPYDFILNRKELTMASLQ